MSLTLGPCYLDQPIVSEAVRFRQHWSGNIVGIILRQFVNQASGRIGNVRQTCCQRDPRRRFDFDAEAPHHIVEQLDFIFAKSA